MVRIKRAQGSWEDLTEAKPKPEPFQRADGSRMTEQEIARVSEVDTKSFVKHAGPRPTPVKRYSGEDYWKAVERLGSQTAAAREFGVSQGAVQSGLRTYMKANGIEGDLPGLTHPHVRKPINGAARFEPLEEAVVRDLNEPEAQLPELVPEIVLTDIDDDSEAPVLEDVVKDKPEPLGTQLDRILAEEIAKRAPAAPLRDDQAALILSALIPTNTSWKPLEVSEWLIRRLRVYGFELVLRVSS